MDSRFRGNDVFKEGICPGKAMYSANVVAWDVFNRCSVYLYAMI